VEFARITTPLSRLAMAEAIVEGHKRYFGALPSMLRLAVAWSQCALEHAAGAKLYNFNFGNVTCGPTWDGDFYVMHVPPPDPPVLRFRAFESAELGAADYWGMLAGHYRAALRVFDIGDAYSAAYLLGDLGYYTAKKESYAAGVEKYKAFFDRELAILFAEKLAEGEGNSVLSQGEIDQVLSTVIPVHVDDPILEPDAIREQPTDPELATIPPEAADDGQA
jgi:hypothetical protein